MKLSISMTQEETVWGIAYLLFSLFIFPFCFAILNSILAVPLSEEGMNLIFFAVNFLAVVAIFHRFLWASLRDLKGKLWRCLGIAGLGLVVYFIQMLIVSTLIHSVKPDFSNVNDASIFQMSQHHRILISLFTVFLVPITEEVLYRGLVFQGLRRRNPLLAYGMSICIFSAIHVVGYVGLYDRLTLLLCFIQYLPAGITLALAYDKANTIVTPILIHILINLIGVSAMR